MRATWVRELGAVRAVWVEGLGTARLCLPVLCARSLLALLTGFVRPKI